MNRPGSRAFCGHPSSLELYESYRRIREELVGDKESEKVCL